MTFISNDGINMKILSKIVFFSLFLFSLSYSGTLLDHRDGQTYATVKIGDLEWMAENLNYDSEYSSCYNDSLENCTVFGRLYHWLDAKTICPKGWHLPSEDEFRSLVYAATDADVLGKELKSASRWNGSDALKFHAIPGGYCYYSTEDDTFDCSDRGNYALFWSSKETDRDSVYRMHLESKITWARLSKTPWILYEEKDTTFYYLSVRCVKNKTEVAQHNAPTTNYQEEDISAEPTAICRDGTQSYSQTRSGTCAGHGGVEKWMDSEEEQNVRQIPREVEKRYEQPTYYHQENSAPQPTAICADGTPSYSQGRGTCSHHGGVKEKTNSKSNQNSNQSDFGIGSLINLFF